MADEIRGRKQGSRGAWERPPVDQRVDQAREWSEIAVAALRHPALPALDAAWRRAVAEEGAAPPSRAAFRPTDVADALGRITVLERVAAGTAPAGAAHPGTAHTWRYRLVGTSVADMVQEELTGQTIDRFHAGLVDMVRAQFARVEAAGRPVAFTVRAVVDHRRYAYERIVLPVRSAPGREPDQMVVASIPTERG